MVDEIVAKVSLERIKGHIGALEGVRHPVAAPEALERAAQYLAEHLDSLGYQMGEHEFSDGGGLYRNIIAVKPGLKHPEQRVAVMAHYDTVSCSPGADDNASGVAVMLEIARLLAPLSLECTVLLVGLNLEENADESRASTGTRGSQALAAHAKSEGWDLKGVLVLESVAYAGPDVEQRVPAGVPIPVPKEGDFIALVANQASAAVSRTMVEAINRHGIPLPHLELVVPGNGELVPDTRRSDHAPFWDQGFPAIMITDSTNFRSPHYHTPTDTMETLNLDFATRVGQTTLGAVLHMAGFIGA
jgi:Zn-dependent M28 family amino/carboxypeptidase